MNSTDILTTLVTVLLGGGFIGGLVAFIKMKPESDQIVVSSAKDVVLIQKGVIDDIRQQMEELEQRFINQLKAAEEARQRAEEALRAAEQERRELIVQYQDERRRNVALVRRMEALEVEVAQLRAAAANRQ